MDDSWFVYVLVSQAGGRTYVGASKDPERRLQEHNGEIPGGAKATLPWRPWRIGRVYGPIATQSEAARLEARIKKLSGKDRLKDIYDHRAC